MRKVLLSLFMMLALVLQAQTNTISLIPQPAEMAIGSGAFTLDGKVTISYPKCDDCDIASVVENFAEELSTTTGVKVKKSAFKNLKTVEKIKAKGTATILMLIDGSMGKEAYKLDVTARLITIKAAQPAGFFYAFQTIKQLLPRNVMAGVPDSSVKEWSIPVVSINDEPRFEWRGFMLDEGRHFYGMDEIKKIIDVMAAYKMNRFHWHLTEDQGWRIEIKKYPKLTEVGAWRDSEGLAWGEKKPDGKRYGGFYTQEQAKEVVAYAKERFVEIVPEIDIPGHSQAAVASYPEILACDPENKHEVWLWQGVSSDVINVANPAAVQFAKDVIDEITEVFPFGYIHLGGDECPTRKWEKNEQCKALLKEIGSDKFRDLQINFYRQLKEHVAAKPADKQRRLIFWNEVLHGNTASLGTDITIMAWIGADRAAKDAATRGMTTILTPQIPYYINRRQSKLESEPHSQGYGNETVEAVYNYIPMNNVPEELQDKYMGVQANFWTEWVISADIVEYLMLPRLAAVAEAGWTPQSKRDYKNFVERLQAEKRYYNLKGVNFGKHVFK